MTDSERMRITFLGLYGLHGKTIARIVKRIDGSKFSVSQIYKALGDSGVRLRDWRDGKGTEVRTVLDAAKVADLKQPKPEEVLRLPKVFKTVRTRSVSRGKKPAYAAA